MLINVITPTLSFNDYLHASIDSVKNQKNLNREFKVLHYVVVDDKNLELPVNYYSENYNLIYLKVEGTRKGPSHARNLALKVIESGYVFFLDGDDLWDDFYLYEVLKIYKDSKITSVSVLGKLLINSRISTKNAQVSACEKIINKYIYWNIIGCPSGFSYNLDRCSSTLFFNESLRYFEDWYFYLNLLNSNPNAVFYRTCKTKYYYRISNVQATSKINTNYVKEAADRFFISDFNFSFKHKFIIKIHLFRQYLKLTYGYTGRVISAILLFANFQYVTFKLHDLKKEFNNFN